MNATCLRIKLINKVFTEDKKQYNFFFFFWFVFRRPLKTTTYYINYLFHNGEIRRYIVNCCMPPSLKLEIPECNIKLRVRRNFKHFMFFKRK